MKKTRGRIGRQTAGLPSRETFEKLMLATHNIGPGVEPGNVHGEIAVEAAMRTTKVVYGVLDEWFGNATTKTKRDVVDGVVTALRLLAETTCSKTPEEYARFEAEQGEEGLRHEFVGAAIELPNEVQNAISRAADKKQKARTK